MELHGANFPREDEGVSFKVVSSLINERPPSEDQMREEKGENKLRRKQVRRKQNFIKLEIHAEL